LQPPEPRKPAEGPEFKLPDVPKLTFDTPKEIADKALPEALKNLPPPPTPSEPPGQTHRLTYARITQQAEDTPAYS